MVDLSRCVCPKNDVACNDDKDVFKILFQNKSITTLCLIKNILVFSLWGRDLMIPARNIHVERTKLAGVTNIDEILKFR